MSEPKVSAVCCIAAGQEEAYDRALTFFDEDELAALLRWLESPESRNITLRPAACDRADGDCACTPPCIVMAMRRDGTTTVR